MGTVRALVPKGVTLQPFVSSVSFIKLGSDGNLYILDDNGNPVVRVSDICQVLPFAPTAKETTAESKPPAEQVVLKDMGDDDEVVLVSEVPLIGVKFERSDW